LAILDLIRSSFLSDIRLNETVSHGGVFVVLGCRWRQASRHNDSTYHNYWTKYFDINRWWRRQNAFDDPNRCKL